MKLTDLKKVKIILLVMIVFLSYQRPVQATSNGNTAVMKQQIEAARGDVIELKITNKNTESIPATGIHLAKNQQVCILLVISIAVGLIFWRKNKNKAMRR